MKFWNQYPLIRILLPLVLGILFAYFIPEIPDIQYIPIVLIVVYLFWYFVSNQLLNFKYRFLSGVFLVLIFFSIGFFLTKSEQQQQNNLHYSNSDEITHFLVRIDAPFSATQKTHKTVGKILAVKTNIDSIPRISFGKLLLYFQKKDTLLLEYGDELLISSAKLRPIKNMGNPYEFDYKAYLSRHQIFDQLYLVETDWIKTGRNSANLLLKWSTQVRNRLVSILNSYDYSSANFAVASAILVGYDEYLDQDLRQLYAGSGAMHILCVSGLHVGILFLLLNVLLKPLEKRKTTRYVKTIIIVLIIWFYALITGMSPSVFRAATMFSFISLGQMINRKTSTYNSLAASAVVLILVDPLVIFHIGFQLSYSAILGILLIQPMISSWFKINNIIGKYFWDLLAVSIAAQIGTFPISIFYFHQFPNYFFITNLFVIPASFVILITGFITLAFDLIGISNFPVFNLAKYLLNILLEILNKGIDMITQLPYSVSYDLFFTVIDVWLIYIIIAFMILAILRKKVKLIYATISTFIVLMVFNGLTRYSGNLEDSEVITFYNTPDNAILELSRANKSLIFIDSLEYYSENFSRYIIGNQLHKRINKKEFVLLDTLINEPKLLRLGGYDIFICDRHTKLPEDIVNVDFLWLRNNPRINPVRVFEKIKAGTLIYDASNAYWNSKKWAEQCEIYHTSFYNLKEKGAYLMKAP